MEPARSPRPSAAEDRRRAGPTAALPSPRATRCDSSRAAMRRVVESRDPIAGVAGPTAGGGLDAIRPVVGQPVEPAGLRALREPAVEGPVDEVRARPSAPTAIENGRKSSSVPLRRRAAPRRTSRKVPPALRDLVAVRRSGGPSRRRRGCPGNRRAGRPRCSRSPGPRAAELAGDDRQGPVGGGQELVRVAVVAADDVVGQAVRPLLAVVVVAVGEDLVGRGQGDRERVPLAGRDDLQARAVGPDPDHAAAEQRDRRAVPADPARDALVADRDVEEPVHPQPDARGDVVVDPVEARDLRARGR